MIANLRLSTCVYIMYTKPLGNPGLYGGREGRRGLIMTLACVLLTDSINLHYFVCNIPACYNGVINQPMTSYNLLLFDNNCYL